MAAEANSKCPKSMRLIAAFASGFEPLTGWKN